MATELQEVSDEKLLSYIQQGDRQAFAALVKRHSTTYYRLAYRYMAHREEAEDMVQVAFLKLWQNPDSWQPSKGTKFTTWFYRVMVNLCLDQKKKKPFVYSDGLELQDSLPTAEEHISRNESQLLLEEAIAALPNRQQTALNLCVYEALSHKEAAEIMGIGVKALESLITRAKGTLKTYIRGKDRG